jgi:hypothetical protein
MVRQVVTLDKMRGHLLVALPLWKAGDSQSATIHASHPSAELYAIVQNDLKAVCQDSATVKVLADFTAQVSDAKSDPAAVQKTYDAALKQLDLDVSALTPPDALADPIFTFKVTRGLLEAAYNDYSEGYTDGKITLPIEYQDSMGFVNAGYLRFQAIHPTLAQKYPDLDKAASDAWAKLMAGYPSTTPPDKPMSPDDLDALNDGLKSDAEKAFNTTLDTPLTPIEYLNNTRDKLVGALNLYRDGHADMAYEAAASAYLDNYENVEAALSAKDNALMTKLETNLKVFRDAIKAGKPIDDVQKLYDDINADLTKAIALFQ